MSWPQAQFSIYSGYQTPDNPERYGINWHYLGDERACGRRVRLQAAWGDAASPRANVPW